MSTFGPSKERWDPPSPLATLLADCLLLRNCIFPLRRICSLVIICLQPTMKHNATKGEPCFQIKSDKIICPQKRLFATSPRNHTKKRRNWNRTCLESYLSSVTWYYCFFLTACTFLLPLLRPHLSATSFNYFLLHAKIVWRRWLNLPAYTRTCTWFICVYNSWLCRITKTTARRVNQNKCHWVIFS